MFVRNLRKKKKLRNGRKSWIILALCRFSLGICIYILLLSLIFKVIIMSHEHVSNTKRIWFVFGILSVVTIVEVFLGIIKPDFLHMNNFLHEFIELDFSSS
jgi:hypothetical protein